MSDFEWLDDAFDDEKAKEEMEEARKSNNRSCLITAVLLAVIFLFILIAFSLFSCGAIATIAVI